MTEILIEEEKLKKIMKVDQEIEEMIIKIDVIQEKDLIVKKNLNNNNINNKILNSKAIINN